MTRFICNFYRNLQNRFDYAIKFIGIETGAADQHAVQVLQTDKAADILGIDTAAVNDAEIVIYNLHAKHIIQGQTDDLVRILGL